MFGGKQFFVSKKQTVSKQLTIIFVGLMAGIIFLCLLANGLLLEKYYMYKKQEALTISYMKIAQAQTDMTKQRDQFAATLNDLALRYNISMCVLDLDSETKYISSNGGEHLDVRLMGYVFGLSAPKAKVLVKTDNYVLQRTKENKQEFLELYGRLENGTSFLLQTTVESIHESARLGIGFFALVGVIGLVIGAIIIATVTRKITKPLRELNELSDRMVHLDFDAKYRGFSHNEIGTLGENMNVLSSSLEKTISELKSANVELQKDIEKKEQIDEMRKEFLANVSHELKTPIALIQGYAEGLLDNISDSPEDRNYYCEVIIDEANKMNHMVKQLMSLNQLEFGNEMVSLERVDLATLVCNYIQQSEILLQEKSIQVCLNFDANTKYFVWGDAFKLEEVFQNYFTNAMNHCDGAKEIMVSITNLELDRKQRVRLSVENTGNAIPEESLSLVWDKFYKVDKARTREYGGSGVGLSIVKAIMESLNGTYGVYNTENGVCFWFELEGSQMES